MLEIFWSEWEDKVYCYVTLSFGWAPLALIYCTLTGACSTFTRKITLAPVLDLVDDIFSGTSNVVKNAPTEIKFQSANRTSFVLTLVLFYAGYYINIPKSNLFPVRVLQFLGTVVDLAQAMFYVPPRKVNDLIERIQGILSQKHVSASQLE